MFETLTERLQGVFRNLSRRGKLRPADVDTALQEIRLALLEADVHYQVVKDFLETVREESLGEDISRSLNPAQQVVGILNRELIVTLGEPAPLTLVGEKPRAIMLVGLQGSGKTTTAAKLARWLRGHGERVWMVAADPRRPAAAEQLKVLGDEIGVPVFFDPKLSPPNLCEAGKEEASKGGASVVILDTAGRSQLDQPMMEELRDIRDAIHPVEVLLVADAMTGQEALRIAQGFQEPLGLTGMILSKMDGDARGGAAISMRVVTGVPIKFIGTGEARDALETFDPNRLASRILGMGDLRGLYEKAEGSFDMDQAGQQAARLLQGEFTLEDFLEQLAMMRRMGPLGKLLEMFPTGFGGANLQVDGNVAERQLIRTQAIIQSMTSDERRRPDLLNASRKRRIASGSGTTVQEVNQLLRQYKQMRRMFKKAGKRGMTGLPFKLR
ncbi:MAG TPA: signal recognition particle protein [Anaerolineae bacterium]|nr:signal recognition particle protein [Anaerolineae bacterium]